MSTSFDIFPTKKNIPGCDEIIEYSLHLFYKFLESENILCDIDVKAAESSLENEKYKAAVTLVSNEANYTVFNLNKEGQVYVFYHELEDIDREFWYEELKDNSNARSLGKKIDNIFEAGYCWNVKRTMGQPAIVSLYYGYLAIAIAVLTDGIIYSDDGAWEYSSFPVGGKAFENEYLNIGKLSDSDIKESINNWLGLLKKM